jgi:hypothetical protein
MRKGAPRPGLRHGDPALALQPGLLHECWQNQLENLKERAHTRAIRPAVPAGEHLLE